MRRNSSRRSQAASSSAGRFSIRVGEVRESNRPHTGEARRCLPPRPSSQSGCVICCNSCSQRRSQMWRWWEHDGPSIVIFRSSGAYSGSGRICTGGRSAQRPPNAASRLARRRCTISGAGRHSHSDSVSTSVLRMVSMTRNTVTSQIISDNEVCSALNAAATGYETTALPGTLESDLAEVIVDHHHHQHHHQHHHHRRRRRCRHRHLHRRHHHHHHHHLLPSVLV